MTATAVVVGVLLAAGAFFVVVGAIGFARLPDVFSRLHVTGILDTMGAPLILLAAAVYVGPSLVSIKLILGMAFISLTSPIVAHLLARAAVEAGHEPEVATEGSDLLRGARAGTGGGQTVTGAEGVEP